MGLATSVRIGCEKFEPYLNYCENIDDFCMHCHDGQKFGIDFDILRYALQLSFGKYGFEETTTSVTKFKQTGAPINQSNPTGAWYGLIGSVMNGSTDIALAALHVDSNRFHVIDYTFPACHVTPSVFVIHPNLKPMALPSLTQIYDLEVWIVGLLSLVFISPDDMSAPPPGSSMHDSKLRYDSRMTLFDSMFQILFEKRKSLKWSNFQNRLIITLWAGCSIFGLRTFSALYVLSLTPSVNKNPFETVEQLGHLLKQKSYKLIVLNSGFTKDSVNINSDYKPWKPLRDSLGYTHIYVENFTAGLEILLTTRGTVCPMLKTTGSKVIHNTAGLLMVPDTSTNQITMSSFAVAKRLNYTWKIAESFLALQELGIVEKIFREYGIFQNEKKAMTRRSQASLKALTIHQTKEALVWLSCAALVSAVVFGTETVWHRLKAC